MPGEREQLDGALLSEDRAYSNPLGFLGCLWASSPLPCKACAVSLAAELALPSQQRRGFSAGASWGKMQPMSFL